MLVFSKDPDLVRVLEELRFFGHNKDKIVANEGLNAKLTEIHAALGLVNLNYLDDVLKRRKRDIFDVF